MGCTKRVSWHQRSLPCVRQKNIRTLDATPNTHTHTHTHAHVQPDSSVRSSVFLFISSNYFRPTFAISKAKGCREWTTHTLFMPLSVIERSPFPKRDICSICDKKQDADVLCTHTRLMTFLPQQEIPWIAWRYLSHTFTHSWLHTNIRICSAKHNYSPVTFSSSTIMRRGRTPVRRDTHTHTQTLSRIRTNECDTQNPFPVETSVLLQADFPPANIKVSKVKTRTDCISFALRRQPYLIMHPMWTRT